MKGEKIQQYLATAVIIGIIAYASFGVFFGETKLDKLPHPLPGLWEETHTETNFRDTVEFSENSVRLGNSWKEAHAIVFDGDAKTGVGKYEIYLLDDAFDFVSVYLDENGLIDVVGVDEAGEYRDGSPRYRSIDYGKFVKR